MLSYISIYRIYQINSPNWKIKLQTKKFVDEKKNDKKPGRNILIIYTHVIIFKYSRFLFVVSPQTLRLPCRNLCSTHYIYRSKQTINVTQYILHCILLNLPSLFWSISQRIDRRTLLLLPTRRFLESAPTQLGFRSNED